MEYCPVIPPEEGQFEIRLHRKKEGDKISLFCYLDYYVYIIQSKRFGMYYKGYTTNPGLRLLEQGHNGADETAFNLL